jgi:hypothetical protein
MGWVLPYHLATTDVLLAHGPEAARSAIMARRTGLLRALGMETVEARAAATERAKQIYERIFALADGIVAQHPGIVD